MYTYANSRHFRRTSSLFALSNGEKTAIPDKIRLQHTEIRLVGTTSTWVSFASVHQVQVPCCLLHKVVLQQKNVKKEPAH